MPSIHVVFAVLVSLVAGWAFAEPEVFSDAGFPSDQTFAVENDKLHVIYFTATWCPPCQQMKKTTWVDESLVSWLNENAIVTSVDVDEYRELSEDYFVSAMPTIAVYRGDEEIARTVGYQGAVEFKDWLERAERGEIENTMLADLEAERLAELEVQRWYEEIAEKMSAASDAVLEHNDKRALQLYLEIWDEIYKDISVMDYCDIEFEIEYASELSARHEPAMTAFTELRDREEGFLRSGDVTWDRLTGWAILNGFMNDDKATLAWIERRLASEHPLPEYNVMRTLCDEVMLEHRRFDLLGQIVDPESSSLESVRFYHSMAMLDDADYGDVGREEMLAYARDSLRWELSHNYAMAIGIGQPDAAKRIAAMLLEIDDSDEARSALQEAAEELELKPLGLDL